MSKSNTAERRRPATENGPESGTRRRRRTTKRADAPIPLRPSALASEPVTPLPKPERTPLPVLEGELGPRATRYHLGETYLEGNKRYPVRPAAEIEAERVILRSAHGGICFQDKGRASLAGLISMALGVNEEDLEHVEGHMLSVIEHDLAVVQMAVRDLGESEEGVPDELSEFIWRMRQRMTAAREIARRTRREPPETAKDSACTVAPPAHEVAGALLTMPGVLTGEHDELDRVLRICERLNVNVYQGGPAFKAMGSYSSVRQRVKDGPMSPYIVIDETDADIKAEVIATMLGHVVANRDGYGTVDDTWCRDLAGYLLQRPLKALQRSEPKSE